MPPVIQLIVMNLIKASEPKGVKRLYYLNPGEAQFSQLAVGVGFVKTELFSTVICSFGTISDKMKLSVAVLLLALFTTTLARSPLYNLFRRDVKGKRDGND
ncbi:Hypothetical predicted protein, partial [Paramuricea clavata]